MPATAAAPRFRIPVYRVQLVRETSQTSEVRKVSTPEVAARVVREYLEGVDREHFVVLLLDTQNQIRGIHTVTVGTLDASLVHPREVFKPAILASSAAIIFAHNHPSGDETPSAEDRAVTRQLRRAGEILGIEVLDSIIVGDGTNRWHSFREAGDLDA